MRQQILRIYGSTLTDAKKLTADVPGDRFAEQPYAGAKHPAWVLGHLSLASGMALDHIRGNPGGFGSVPEAWAEMGMPGVEVRADRALYAPKDELLATLERAHGELAAAFEAASDETLASPFPIEEWREFFPTIADMAVYVMAHHEGYHLGQLSQWRRAAGFGPAEA